MRNIVLTLLCVGVVGAGCGKGNKLPPPDPKEPSHFGQAPEIEKLSGAVYKFISLEHRAPTDWQEVVDKKYLPAVPKAPAGKKYVWNEAGQVSLEAGEAAPTEK